MTEHAGADTAAILTAYQMVMAASWPDLHPEMAARAPGWAAARAETLTEELHAYLRVASEPSCAVRIFWKLTPKYTFGGCNEHFAKDAGLPTSEMIGIDDFDRRLPWVFQAAKYRTDDEAVVKSGKAKLNIIERQKGTSGSITWVKVGKAPIRSGDQVIGVLGMYEVLDPEEGRKLFRAAERQGLTLASPWVMTFGASAVDIVRPALPHSIMVRRVGCWAPIALALLGGCSDATAPSLGIAPRVAVGGEFACALSSTGRAYCWGKGEDGQLGNGADTNATRPVAVTGDHRFVSIGAGWSSACALTGTGVAYCWGHAFEGQLGAGADTTHSHTPRLVAGGLRFRSLSVGYSHTCGVTSDDHVYCWGFDDSGALGDSGLAPDLCNGFPCARTPQPVSPSLTFRSVAAGFGTTCAITPEGTAYCWGANYYGNAGADTAVNPVYVPAPIAGGLTFRELDGGYFHTCGIDTGGLARCWGNGMDGELGNGTSGPQAITSSPVAVSGGVTFTSLAAGAYFSCALATNGAILCWGTGYGALGNGTVTGSNTPVAVAASIPFQSVAAAEERACGVSQTGDVYCWGWNYYGLGDGVNSVSFLPLRVPLP